MEILHFSPGIKKVQETSSIGYVKDGKLFQDASAPVIQIESQSQLSDIANIPECGPGTIAYTAGWKAAWQLKSNGIDWEQMF